eukprot:m.146491 g.146491  ORF g.146491 m.146491 type:complete len:480 (+) comp17255_c0_seq1:213-1652(+)
MGLSKLCKPRRAAAVLIAALLVFIMYTRPPATCADDIHVCSDGAIVGRTLPSCSFSCPLFEHQGLRTELLWNAPLHSWQGVSSEAVDFLVPLSALLPNLALVGGWAEDYVKELPASDGQALRELRERSGAIKHKHEHEQSKRLSSIFVTQYDPGTYPGDIERHHGATFDFRIGRAMFETTSLPSQFVENCKLMDEIWVPSTWGAEQFVAAGVAKEKLVVVPEAVDTTVFNPVVVAPKPSLLPNREKRFAFLSVFKWEDRKNWHALVHAYALAFQPKDKVVLYIRGGEEATVTAAIKEHLTAEGFKEWPTIQHVPKVKAADYPALYRTADAFVLPTHAEGWGRPIMEAMAMGLPTIVTGWSGQTGFVNDETAFLIPVKRLSPAFPNEPQLLGWDPNPAQFQWADVDPAALAKLMRYVHQHPQQAETTGLKAQKHIHAHFSRTAVSSQHVMPNLRRVQATIADDYNSKRKQLPPLEQKPAT